MSTFPPYNPENLPPAAPGYRYLGKDEAIKLEHDEVLNNRREPNSWKTLLDIPYYDEYASRWTIRRPINVDDPSAPPPEEWAKPGYEVIKGPIEGAHSRIVIPGLEMWSPSLASWRSGKCSGNSDYYYRQSLPVNTTPSAPSMTTSTPSKVVLKPGQSIVVNVHQNEALSRAVQEIAFAAGWEWPWMYVKRNYFPGAAGQKVLYIYIDPHKHLSWDSRRLTGRADGVHLDARTDLGTLIDLLAAPAITPPTINGYKAQYAKGDDVVTFGCAKIERHILRKANELLGAVTSCGGNRTVASITLDSGVKLTRDDIKAVLDYVDAVNKAV